MKKRGRPNKAKNSTIITLYVRMDELSLINAFCEKKGITRGRLLVDRTIAYIMNDNNDNANKN